MNEVIARLAQTQQKVIQQSGLGVSPAAASGDGGGTTISLNDKSMLMWIGLIAIFIVLTFLVVTHRKIDDF